MFQMWKKITQGKELPPVSCGDNDIVAMADGTMIDVARGVTAPVMLAAMAVVMMMAVVFMLPAAVGVGVVGLLVDPAVEQVGTQIADDDPAQHGQDIGGLRRVAHQVEADHAEHDARRKAQQETDGSAGGIADRGGQSAAQGQPSCAGKGGDEKNQDIGVHERCSISKICGARFRLPSCVLTADFRPGCVKIPSVWREKDRPDGARRL